MHGVNIVRERTLQPVRESRPRLVLKPMVLHKSFCTNQARWDKAQQQGSIAKHKK